MYNLLLLGLSVETVNWGGLSFNESPRQNISSMSGTDVARSSAVPSDGSGPGVAIGDRQEAVIDKNTNNEA